MRRDVVRLVRQSVVLTLALGFASCTDDYSPMQPSLTASYVTPTGLVTANPPQIFIGAGDISSCSNSGDEATAKVLDANLEGTVFNIGDDAYNNGTTAEFACYHSTWGRHKTRTKPNPGNHEYNTNGASGYFQYFGASAGPSGLGYYSFDLGAWHLISLNSNVSSSTSSAQHNWLVADLAAHPNQCTLAYYHHPLYSSYGSGSGGITYSSVRQLVNDLYAAHADVILNGHRHFYERIAPMKPDGTADPVMGVREFVVGSGGIGGGGQSSVFPLSEARNGSTFGVIKLYLYDDSYAWKFLPVAGKTYTDSGSTACHFSGGGSGGGGVSAANSSVSAAPGSFIAGSGSSTITVVARDGSNATMSGANVVFASTGSGNTFTPPSATTNGSGVATSTFTSTAPESKTVSATIEGTLINQTAPVTVNPSGGGGGGTISQALLTSGSDLTNLKIYTTGSISPAPNTLVTLAVLGRNSGAAFTPTVSGGGMSAWAQVASVDLDPISGSLARLVVFRAMSGSPGSGPITITYSSTMKNAQWLVSQWSGVDQSGTNGLGAIGQTGPAQGDAVTTLSVPLTAFANSNNVGFGLVGSGQTVTPGSGFTEIAEATSGETGSTLLEGEWGTNQNAVAANWASSNAGMLGLEIKAGAPSGPVVSPTLSTVSVSPGSIMAGGSGSLITVTAKDVSNNPIVGATVGLSVTGTGNALPAPAVTDGSGQTSSTLTSTKTESKTVSATINGVAITQTQAVTVTPGADAALVFTAQPTNTAANAPITPAVVVEVRDTYNNRTGSSASVTTAIGSGPGTLAGTLSQTASAGAASFGDLSINTIANGYTLSASALGLTGATSSTFNITTPQPSAANSTVSAVTPSFTAGGNSAINIVVKDGLGNAMSGVTVTLSSSVGGDVITQPAATDGSGAASGTVAATAAGLHKITATAGTTTLNQKPDLTVSAGSPDAGQTSFTASPLTITQTTGSSNLTVTVRDQYGNPVSGSAVSFSASPSTGVGFGGGGSTNTSGVATGTMTSSVAEVKTLTALAGILPITQTQDVTVTPPSSGITQTLLTAGSDVTNQKIYTTASITPAANALITIAVIGHTSTAASASPTITGAGLTWVEVTSTTFNSIATPLKRMSIFRAMSASPSTGPLTITFPTTESNAAWIVSQWTGVDQTGTNGSGAVGTISTPSQSDAATSISATLAALGGPNNVAYGVVGTNGSAVGINPSGSFAEISEQKPAEGTNSIVEALFAANQTVPAASWTGSFAAAILAIEIKAGP